MAAPTPTLNSTQVGQRTQVEFHAVWGAGETDFADYTLLDISSLAGGYVNSPVICYALLIYSSTMRVTLEFDCTADQPFLEAPANGPACLEMDYTPLPLGGVCKLAAGGTGDPLITTSGATTGDSVFVILDVKTQK